MAASAFSPENSAQKSKIEASLPAEISEINEVSNDFTDVFFHNLDKTERPYQLEKHLHSKNPSEQDINADPDLNYDSVRAKLLHSVAILNSRYEQGKNSAQAYNLAIQNAAFDGIKRFLYYYDNFEPADNDAAEIAAEVLQSIDEEAKNRYITDSEKRKQGKENVEKEILRKKQEDFDNIAKLQQQINEMPDLKDGTNN